MIDSHVHLWKYKAANYPWITGEMAALQHDHCIAELEDDLEFSGVDQVIAVQSRRSDRENHFLLEQTRKSDGFIAGIVGWAPLDSDDLRVFLDQYLHEPMLVGVRETFDSSSADELLDNPDFDHGVSELARQDLALELMVSEQQLPMAMMFADRHPNQRIAINHFASPSMDSGTPSDLWSHAVRELARRPHVYCKISGLSARMDSVSRRSTHSQVLKPYFETLCKAFGPERLMFGSNWPVCNLTTTYPAWLNTVDDLILPLSEDEQQAIRQETAKVFYHIE
ncbi:MAG: amidohydrolase family protein [Akkermansiaceae bacterium]